jgi:hypothetical protein
MSINDINNAAAAMNQLKARYEGFLDDADAEIAQRQGAYDGLAANLTGIVRGQMDFVAKVDPNLAEFSLVDNGTFPTIASAINAAPFGSNVFINLPPGGEYSIDEAITLNGKNVILYKFGAGINPVVKPTAYLTGGENYFFGFSASRGGTIRFSSVDVTFPAKADEAYGWSSLATMMRYNHAGFSQSSYYLSTITGAEGLGLTSAHVGGVAVLGLYGCTLDGAIFGVRNADTGVAIISASVVTLTNGAALNQGGTIGVNLLKT